MPDLWIMIGSLSLFTALYCDSNIQLIFSTASFGVRILVINFVFDLKSREEADLLNKFLVCIFYYASCSCIAIVIIFVSKLLLKHITTNRESLKLLDGMHQGLLILSKGERRTMFCNRPA